MITYTPCKLSNDHVKALLKTASDSNRPNIALHSVGTVYCNGKHWKIPLGMLTWHVMRRVVDELEESGLMIEASPGDDRSPRLVTLTDAGTEYAEALKDPNCPRYFAVMDGRLVYGDEVTVFNAHSAYEASRKAQKRDVDDIKTKRVALLSVSDTARMLAERMVKASSKPKESGSSVLADLLRRPEFQEDQFDKTEDPTPQAEATVPATTKPETRAKAKAKAKAKKPTQVLQGAAFIQHVFEHVRSLPYGTHFTGDSVRIQIESSGVFPHHHNTWGSAISYCNRHGLMKETGKFPSVKTPSGHSRRTPQYRRCAPPKAA